MFFFPVKSIICYLSEGGEQNFSSHLPHSISLSFSLYVLKSCWHEALQQVLGQFLFGVATGVRLF